jgi:hypothetical protein
MLNEERIMQDLFGHLHQNDFHWIVAVFANTGAVDAIRRANEIPLKTFYPIRFNGHGQPMPMWRHYLFIEYREILTTQVCRSTKKFIKILSMRDQWGQEYPVMVRKNAINDHLNLLLAGQFDERVRMRRFYGVGSLVRVIDGNFIDKRVRLEMDVDPKMPGTQKVSVSIGNWNGKIELWKLSL